MIKAIDIANFFIDLSNSLEEELMTNLKVNKLVYLAQAWSLVRLGKPLFCENIQAWQYGPVIPSVYNTFKVCGANNIENVFGEYNQKIFSPEELDLLIDILYQIIILLDSRIEDRSEKLEVLLDRQILIKRELSGHIADKLAYPAIVSHDIQTGNPRCAPVGKQKRREDAEQGSFARTIRTDDAVKFSSIDRET